MVRGNSCPDVEAVLRKGTSRVSSGHDSRRPVPSAACVSAAVVVTCAVDAKRRWKGVWMDILGACEPGVCTSVVYRVCLKCVRYGRESVT